MSPAAAAPAGPLHCSIEGISGVYFGGLDRHGNWNDQIVSTPAPSATPVHILIQGACDGTASVARFKLTLTGKLPKGAECANVAALLVAMRAGGAITFTAGSGARVSSARVHTATAALQTSVSPFPGVPPTTPSYLYAVTSRPLSSGLFGGRSITVSAENVLRYAASGGVINFVPRDAPCSPTTGVAELLTSRGGSLTIA